jgi:hypothetical protein
VKKTGSVYLMVDPTLNTNQVMDIRRIFLPRVEVTLIKIHRVAGAINPLRRYEVLYNGYTYRTGRLETPKSKKLPVGVAAPTQQIRRIK